MLKLIQIQHWGADQEQPPLAQGGEGLLLEFRFAAHAQHWSKGKTVSDGNYKQDG